MNLSISSSKIDNKSFIVKSLIVCIFLFLIYNLYISSTPPKITVFDNQFKNNISVAQRYIYDYSQSPFVIVGSSLAATLDNEILLANRIYNLSLKGSGPMSGLSLIAKSNAKPKMVLIEINSILSKANYTFLEKLMSPMQFKLKKIFPSLRDEFQPINVFINILMNLSNKNRSLNVYDQKRFKKAFSVKKQKYLEPPDMSVFAERLDELSLLIDKLATHGVKLAFFEMPIHKELKDSPEMNKIRSEVANKFPKGKYLWVGGGLSVSDQETSDGIHLTTEAAISVTEHLVMELKSIY